MRVTHFSFSDYVKDHHLKTKSLYLEHFFLLVCIHHIRRNDCHLGCNYLRLVKSYFRYRSIIILLSYHFFLIYSFTLVGESIVHSCVSHDGLVECATHFERLKKSWKYVVVFVHHQTEDNSLFFFFLIDVCKGSATVHEKHIVNFPRFHFLFSSFFSFHCDFIWYIKYYVQNFAFSSNVHSGLNFISFGLIEFAFES